MSLFNGVVCRKCDTIVKKEWVKLAPKIDEKTGFIETQGFLCTSCYDQRLNNEPIA